MKNPSTNGAPHVLVVGIDGVRFDTLTAARTPSISRIQDAGILLPVQVHANNPTISGPVWSTVATGVYSDRHAVKGNEAHAHNLHEFPDFTQAIREARPGASTMVAASWFPIAGSHDCGRIFSSGGWLPVRNPETAEHAEAAWSEADDQVAEYAARQLASEDLAVSFVYFGEADEFAHHQGTGAGYTASIERCDARLGRLLDSIDSRPTRDRESWTVIVVTDHGHTEGGGHGGDSPEERTAWIAACGPVINTDIDKLCHADIAAQVLLTFGLEATDFDGLPFGQR